MFLKIDNNISVKGDLKMKYEENSKQNKFIGSSGFFTVIACCLVIIGAVSWFAVAKYNKTDTKENKNGSSTKDNVYEDHGSSYIDDEGIAGQEIFEEPNVPNAEMTENTVFDEPYEEPKAEEKSFILPVEGNISKGYSTTALQYSQTYADMRLHLGIDILCEPETKVKACSSGTVVSVEESANLGKVIKIDHGDGLVLHYYGINQCFVKNGDTVSAAAEIGTVGSIPAECVDKSHLHLEAYKNNQNISPLAALNLE